MTDHPSCATCAHVTEEAPNPAGQGPIELGAPRAMYCRRYPPTIVAIPVPGGLAIQHQIPIVTERDWCGEHRPGSHCPAEAAS